MKLTTQDRFNLTYYGGKDDPKGAIKRRTQDLLERKAEAEKQELKDIEAELGRLKG